MNYIETPRQLASPKTIKDVTKTTKKAAAKTNKTKGTKNMPPKEEFKKTKTMHKQEIKKLKSEVRQHRLLIKQAKIVYKLKK